MQAIIKSCRFIPECPDWRVGLVNGRISPRPGKAFPDVVTFAEKTDTTTGFRV